jgi:hypothetical protein
MINPEFAAAYKANVFTPSDFSGLSAQQIISIMEILTKDRSTMMDTAQASAEFGQRERQMQKQQEQFDKSFNLQQQQAIIQGYNTLVNAGLGLANKQIAEKQMRLEGAKFGLEQQKYLENKKLLESLQGIQIPLPFTDKEGKPSSISLGTAMMMGSGTLEQLIRQGFASKAHSFGLDPGELFGVSIDDEEGGSVPGMPTGGKGKVKDLLPAVMYQYFRLMGYNPGTAIVGSTLPLPTPHEVRKVLIDNNVINPTMSQEEQDKKVAETMVGNLNAIQSFMRAMQGSVEEKARVQKAIENAKTFGLNPPTQGVEETVTNSSSNNSPTQKGPNFQNIAALETALTEQEKKSLAKKMPDIFRYSEQQKKYVLRPNALLILAENFGKGASDFASGAAGDVRTLVAVLKEMAREDSSKNATTAQYMRDVILR